MNDSSADKTEEPTPKKLRDARKKGQVLQVKDMASLSTFFVIFFIIFLGGNAIIEGVMGYILFSIDLWKQDGDTAVAISLEMATFILMMAVIILSSTFILTVLFVKISEVGLLFSTEPLKMDFKKINPIEGLKRIYSKKSLVEFGKTFLKSFVLLMLVAVVYRIHIQDVINLYNCDKYCLFPIVSQILYDYIMAVVLVFLVVTVIDYGIQAHFFKKSMMMTKDEVKREYKESEGSPEVKGERKRLHREILNEPAPAKKSSFVVSNPNHYSIAFLFDRNRYKVPFVLIKDINQGALQIKRDAISGGVPVVENIQLARQIYASAKEQEFVPQEFFKPLSDVIAGLVKSGVFELPPKQ